MNQQTDLALKADDVTINLITFCNLELQYHAQFRNDVYTISFAMHLT